MTEASARQRVLALALDAPNHELLLQWMAGGRLPQLERLRQRGLAVTIESRKAHSNEHCWVPVLTGIGRGRWDHWLDRFEASTYRFSEASLFDWLQAPLFYALGERRHVVAFDMAAPVVQGVKGVQVSGFAAELNEAFPQSDPPGLLQELERRLGPDPKLPPVPQRIVNAVSQREGVSWTIPCCYDREAMQAFAASLVQSVQRRTDACLQLMAREPWDLFLAAFTEVHTAGHVLWHLSQPHPLQALRGGGEDPLLAVYQAVDESVGRLAEAAGEDTAVVFFSLDATVVDSLENARIVFLPELLYRWNFPGRAALAVGDAASAVPGASFDYHQHWKHEVWKLRTPEGVADLESPAQQQVRGDPLGWCPANWYAPLWPRMKAFALPSVADGYIRINVAGREAQGCVAPQDFDAVCRELVREVFAMANARTGQPIVREVVRVRADPFDADPKKPPADLIVVFREDGPLDVADTPFGRIGPVPYFRTSSHQSHDAVLRNVLLAGGPGIAPRRAAATARLEDIPATLLDLLGVERPASFDGVSVLR
ncbi:MAG: alkaline phosphatase family protein [Burkholderiales bacterium]|nr:alkaline phosphatase family protein [Burkholderiales bacterium]